MESIQEVPSNFETQNSSDRCDYKLDLGSGLYQNSLNMMFESEIMKEKTKELQQKQVRQTVQAGLIPSSIKPIRLSMPTNVQLVSEDLQKIRQEHKVKQEESNDTERAHIEEQVLNLPKDYFANQNDSCSDNISDDCDLNHKMELLGGEFGQVGKSFQQDEVSQALDSIIDNQVSKENLLLEEIEQKEQRCEELQQENVCLILQLAQLQDQKDANDIQIEKRKIIRQDTRFDEIVKQMEKNNKKLQDLEEKFNDMVQKGQVNLNYPLITTEPNMVNQDDLQEQSNVSSNNSIEEFTIRSWNSSFRENDQCSISSFNADISQYESQLNTYTIQRQEILQQYVEIPQYSQSLQNKRKRQILELELAVIDKTIRSLNKKLRRFRYNNSIQLENYYS